MANEITLDLRLQLANGYVEADYNPGRLRFDQSTARKAGKIQNIGTTAENLDFGDVTNPGYIVLSNLGATNFIEIGYDDSGTFRPCFYLPPNNVPILGYCIVGKTYQAKADTAAGDLIYEVFSR